ncbi:ABC transporter ATP-binding protein [Schnuerera sp.]|uniref:energy-coupling factor ABC transporter ATP-binding protein n=1 Tax=Schnuerera sp. TaxID=2794844 RepID=UPI002C0A5705|nr:ABC transporter ATP-binding protein [Schnuerera sp.]HSH34825.1 ABC transporter ATP-binding protein [Schnuerera sp.]
MNRLDFIKLEDLFFEYKKDKPIINNINLKINKDEVTTILGPNGSGKTTLGKLMIGILKPKSGQISISNRNISEFRLAQIGGKIGYLFQNPEKHFFTNTVEEELGFALKFKGFNDEYLEKKVDGLLKLFQIEDLREYSPLLLSQGEKQRLAIATILMNEPEYLILDEPTTGLDFDRKNILIQVLKELMEKGVGMTIISHDNTFVEELSHRVIKIHRGEITYDQRI